MDKKPNISFTTLLLLTFPIYLVGLPVVFSLCPMMMEKGVPCCSTAETGVPSLTSQTGDCCASYILAERNTTPFVTFAKYVPTDLVAIAFVPDLDRTISSLSQDSMIGGSHSPPSSAGSNPLFILHAALLI